MDIFTNVSSNVFFSALSCALGVFFNLWQFLLSSCLVWGNLLLSVMIWHFWSVLVGHFVEYHLIIFFSWCFLIATLRLCIFWQWCNFLSQSYQGMVLVLIIDKMVSTSFLHSKVAIFPFLINKYWGEIFWDYANTMFLLKLLLTSFSIH